MVSSASAQFLGLLERIPIGVYVIDADFRIAHVHPMAAPSFGDVPGGVIGWDFADVIRFMRERDYAVATGHTLELQLPAEPVSLYGDADRLAQVIANVLNNAARYTDAGGYIWLGAELQQDELCIRVRDNGIGIPARTCRSSSTCSCR